jgi:hypothetical protein
MLWTCLNPPGKPVIGSRHQIDRFGISPARASASSDPVRRQELSVSQVRRRLKVAADIAVVVMLLSRLSTVAFAQSPAPGGMPPPPGMSLAKSAAMRFPQPVRVGDLVHREVLKPVESQTYLGRVEHIVRSRTGALKAVVAYGGVFGFGSRQIAIPIDAMVLVGRVMEVVAYTPKQLAKFPTFSVKDAASVPDDTIIKVGLAKPSH